MSTTTKNYGFIKFEKSDPADITALNTNWDKLDEGLKHTHEEFDHTHEEFDNNISMNGNRITDVAEPKSRSDVATKGFVEDFSIEGSTYVAVDENKDGNVILRPYVPGETISKPVLLWKNDNTSNLMGAQTITVGDVSEYTEYIVQTVNHGQFRSKIGQFIHLPYVNIYDTGAIFYDRGVILSYDFGGTLRFTDCYAWNKSETSTALANNHLIIEAVYGVKGGIE